MGSSGTPLVALLDLKVGSCLMTGCRSKFAPRWQVKKEKKKKIQNHTPSKQNCIHTFIQKQMNSCQALYLKEGIFMVATIKTKSLRFVIVFSLEGISK